MKAKTAEKLDEVMSDLHQFVENLRENPDYQRIITKLKASEIDDEEVLSIGIDLKIYDGRREKVLELYTAGTQVFQDGEQSHFSGGDANEKFLLNGNIEVAPNGHCPMCYEEWPFKENKEACPNCSTTLGKELKFLIDNDICPHCNEGKVTRTSLVCDQCDFAVDPDLTTWG
jgi:hypothetical protein